VQRYGFWKYPPNLTLFLEDIPKTIPYYKRYLFLHLIKTLPAEYYSEKPGFSPQANLIIHNNQAISALL
jgi:hypothetical protein